MKTLFSTYQHWTIEKDAKDILWLKLDRHKSQINTINTEVLSEFKDILDQIEENKKQFKGLIITSAKHNGFAAGADIQQLRNVSSFEEAFELISQGQAVFKQLSQLSLPTVALIHGFCLGGGLELALACNYRVAILDPKTKLGLPEVMLGVHPGWGGTVRLPRLIGGIKALELILSGRSMSAKSAAKMGLVDAAVPIWDAERAVEYYIHSKPPQRKAKGLESVSNWNIARPLIARFMKKKLAEKVNRLHYPAPFIALDNWLKFGVESEEAFDNEGRSIAQLMISDTTKNLVRVFNLQERLKSMHKDNRYNQSISSCDEAQVKASSGAYKFVCEQRAEPATKSPLERPRVYKPTRVHVVGAGVMGGDIATWAAMKGFLVTVQDPHLSAIASAFNRGLVMFKKILKEPHLIQAAQDRLTADPHGQGIRNADIIIEAIIEKKDLKQSLFQTLETKADPSALLASNTSTIPLEDISEFLQDKDRILGLHFFNPVSKMPLVEIAHPSLQPMTEENNLIAKASAFIRALDKLPLPVKSSPGFLVNRVLMPYLLESLQLLDEGLPAAAIDKVIEDFGMPMGPIELIDTVGLDVCLYAFESLSQSMESLKISLEGGVGQRLRSLVEKGCLGRKTGSGFYRYKKGKPIKEPLGLEYRIPEDAQDRMILRMINEAVACLREEIVQDADLLDAGLIFGAGFAPFRGGPIHYVLEQGEGLMLQRLNLLVQRYGNRFLPDPGWSLLDAV